TSTWRFASPSVTVELHAVDRRHQAGALVRRAVDGQQTVVADADTAEESARTPLASGGPPRTHTGPGQRSTNAVFGKRADRLAVESDGDHPLTPNRSGVKGVRSRSVGAPARACVRSFAVPTDRPIPAPSWPLAGHRPA